MIPETPLCIADYEEVLTDNRRLTRELDVLLNGANAARQASLCDIVAQVSSERIRSVHYVPDQHECRPYDLPHGDHDWLNGQCGRCGAVQRSTANQPRDGTAE